MTPAKAADPNRPARPPSYLVTLLLVAVAVAPALALAAGPGALPPWWWVGAITALLFTLPTGALLHRWLRCEGARVEDAVRDATDVRRQLRSVFDTAADGILTFDEDGHIRSVNGAAGKMFGYEPGDLLGQPVEALLPGVQTGPDGRPLVGTGEGRALGLSSTFEGLHRANGPFPVAVGISKVRVKGRALFTTIIHDLTPLHQARHAAEAASRAKSRFLVHMSHELRTPLGGILGMAEVLAGTVLADEQRRPLAALTRSAQDLLALIERLLDYSRLEAGEVALAHRSFSVRGLVHQVLASLGEPACAKGLRLRAEVADSLPDWVIGDPERLREALAAIADNAVKFTAQGEVTVAARPDDAGGLVFEVRDTGAGVPPALQARLFRPFEQGDHSSTKPHGGLGLGLALAARLIALMGGTVRVESAEGQGSVFRFSVPLERADGPGPAAPAVLVVCGEEALRRAWVEEVTAGGWPVASASTGRAALAELMAAIVRGAPFGLALIDGDLPDMPSADLFRWLGGRPERHCPAILLGDGTEVILPDGAVRVLPRRAPGDTLRQAICQALAGAALVG